MFFQSSVKKLKISTFRIVFLFVFQTKYKNMTFVWTEMAFLSMWWDGAHEVSSGNWMVSERLDSYYELLINM